MDEAVDVLKSAIDTQPGYVDLHYQLGLIFAQRQQFQMAIEHYESAVGGNPNNVEFQANLALALQNMGLLDRANASWQLVCNLAPDSAYAVQARVAMAKQRDSE
ncbi:MAG: tetratricopeptide repeat protein [Planctomycetes bacterium]|nr:tetratricopeptide repeat protein [Planctomycetota bacterium]